MLEFVIVQAYLPWGCWVVGRKWQYSWERSELFSFLYELLSPDSQSWKRTRLSQLKPVRNWNIFRDVDRRMFRLYFPGSGCCWIYFIVHILSCLVLFITTICWKQNSFSKLLKVILDVYKLLFIGDVFLITRRLERDGFIFQ